MVSYTEGEGERDSSSIFDRFTDVIFVGYGFYELSTCFILAVFPFAITFDVIQENPCRAFHVDHFHEKSSNAAHI